MNDGSRTATQLHRFTAVLLCSCVAVLLCSSSYAQTATSSLSGKVTTTGDARVKTFAGRVHVIVTSKALQHERRTTTTQWGRYWLTALPPGDYEVTFSRKGLQTVTKRVHIELGRTGRLDAHLEPSEDEESVTATGKTVNVTETTAITTHFSDATLDRLPYPRSGNTAAFLAPGALYLSLGEEGQEALEQVTIFRGAIPAEYDALLPPAVFRRTRSGGEALFLSLRGTLTEGGRKLFEGAAGGRIVPEKLWFFVDAWAGDRIFLNSDRKGGEAKLTAQIGAQHNLTADYARYAGPDSDDAYLQYIGVAGPRFTAEAVGRRTSYPSYLEESSLFLKTTFVASSAFGDHIVSAGGRLIEDDAFRNGSGAFLNDRWVWGRSTMNLGVRHDYGRIHPRAAASFDLLGNGRHAITASFGDYNNPYGFVRELTAGYAMAIGNTGTARVDAIRRDHGYDVETRGLQADFIYSLFDRFHTGASYAFEDFETTPPSGYSRHSAAAWAGVDLPLGAHEFGVTLAGRYRASGFASADDQLTADLALRYSLPVSRIQLTLAADTTNVFDQQPAPFRVGRVVEGWVRVRMLP